ncbi:hypothetical protein [Laspinema olomoucense]|uniref:hypothetical protein n=1 Tax=Laspinema olomoucense TaxID=3231600 RepID=UPI0021BAA961|nr:hypothetical protein [Laspinema sp. D3c]MCT7992920.1 hypothetical protein [Laspinema sp. D3c]
MSALTYFDFGSPTADLQDQRSGFIEAIFPEIDPCQFGEQVAKMLIPINFGLELIQLGGVEMSWHLTELLLFLTE